MNNITLGQYFLKELEEEAAATRKCLERISESLFEYKPHEKSMAMGYLTLLVAEIPLWIEQMVEVGEINFATFKHSQPKTTAEVVAFFDENMAKAKKALSAATDEQMQKMFTLKAGEQVLIAMKMDDSISSTIRHWVHHRGQLTVYMRLNNLAVPSIYGPSADDKNF
ncbi:MAG: DUF664 domain-containing protein [Candidatus Doudnabacteria bacterium]|nr:DUF664 domain-containing protein [Candidatus Doudnabacteria bacterium]